MLNMVKVLKRVKAVVGGSTVREEIERVIGFVSSFCERVCVDCDGYFYDTDDYSSVFFGKETVEYRFGNAVLVVECAESRIYSAALKVDGIECRDAAEIDEAILYCLA